MRTLLTDNADNAAHAFASIQPIRGCFLSLRYESFKPWGGGSSSTSCICESWRFLHSRKMSRPSSACGTHCVHSVGNGYGWSFGVDPWMVYLWTCAHLNDSPTDLLLMNSTARLEAPVTPLRSESYGLDRS